MKPTDIRLCETTLATQLVPYRTPIKFGGRVVREALLVDVAVEAETRDGRRGRGRGSMPLSNVWAWPSANRIAGGRAKGHACAGRGIGPPGQRRSAQRPSAGDHVPTGGLACGDVAPPGRHRRAAGDHPAAGATGGCSALWKRRSTTPTARSWAVTASTCSGRNGSTRTWRPIWMSGLPASISTATPSGAAADDALVSPRGALDPLTDADIADRVNDGLPETLPEWIAADGLTHLKIKLNGDDLEWDVQRVLSVERVAAEAQAARGCSDWRYSADFNEKCRSVDYVTDFLGGSAGVRPRCCVGCSTSSSPCRETCVPGTRLSGTHLWVAASTWTAWRKSSR